MTMPGTPFVYMGDEIGMTNIRLKQISESQDIETKTGWLEAKKRGVSEDQFLKAVNYAGRDNSRTPMQWNGSQYAGFSTHTPWMLVNPNHTELNVAAQEGENDSILHYFRSLTNLRKENPALIYGTYQPVDCEEERIFLYFREWHQEKFMIVLNFSSEVINLPKQAAIRGKRVIGNYPAGSADIVRPWEAVVVKC